MKLTNLSFYCILIFTVFACNNKVKDISQGSNYSEDDVIKLMAKHENPRMHYKLINSKVTDKQILWNQIASLLEGFSEKDYLRYKPFVFEQDIPTIQKSIDDNLLNYEQLTKWYLYRILYYESNAQKTLHTILAINPDVVINARQKDDARVPNHHPIYGMPILLKDNINAAGMATTAGAIALQDNMTPDAEIVRNLKSAGAIILGKVNLSEWAYYFCNGCPLGYSALGGQTLNPYGRMKFETGGSSAGSGTAMAVSYAVAAVGTETAGSILSPSSQNSIVGMKPTVSLLSQNGIIPISSTLDTPGPMTRSVVDNAILLDAMITKPTAESGSKSVDFGSIETANISDFTFGVNATYEKEIPTYKKAIERLESAGAQLHRFTPNQPKLDGFLTVLNYDMKHDMPKYLGDHAMIGIPFTGLDDIIKFNKKDMSVRAPYGQDHFIASNNDDTTPLEIKNIKNRLEKDARKYFDNVFTKHKVDAILSVNNYDAAIAAFAKYPCLAMPMDYLESGEPIALTFIGKTLMEEDLHRIGAAFERLEKVRKVPAGYSF